MLQINLGELNTVTAVATQGRYRGAALVKSYLLAFSRQEGEWFYYKEHGKVKVSSFSACNCDTHPVSYKAITSITRLKISPELSTFNEKKSIVILSAGRKEYNRNKI